MLALCDSCPAATHVPDDRPGLALWRCPLCRDRARRRVAPPRPNFAPKTAPTPTPERTVRPDPETKARVKPPPEARKEAARASEGVPPFPATDDMDFLDVAALHALPTAMLLAAQKYGANPGVAADIAYQQALALLGARARLRLDHSEAAHDAAQG